MASGWKARARYFSHGAQLFRRIIGRTAHGRRRNAERQKTARNTEARRADRLALCCQLLGDMQGGDNLAGAGLRRGDKEDFIAPMLRPHLSPFVGNTHCPALRRASFIHHRHVTTWAH